MTAIAAAARPRFYDRLYIRVLIAILLGVGLVVLRDVALLFGIALRGLRRIALALGIKAVFLVLAIFDNATMWMAVFADMGASLIVVANGSHRLSACSVRPGP